MFTGNVSSTTVTKVLHCIESVEKRLEWMLQIIRLGHQRPRFASCVLHVVRSRLLKHFSVGQRKIMVSSKYWERKHIVSYAASQL